MNEVVIRRAAAADAPAIAEIYNHYVESSTATFDTEAKSVEDREAWLAARDDSHPVLVAEKDGTVIGWGSLSRFRERPAYVHTVEVAVYLAPERRGEGTGAALMAELVRSAVAAGHHVVVSQIVAGNTASIKLAERAGFVRVGTMHQVGRKFGRWLDVEVMELVLES